MANPIVQIAVSVQLAPAPSTLQKTGAFLSQGGTITSPGTKSLLTQLSDLTPLLTPAKALTSLTWSGNVVTATTTAPHGYTQGETIALTIAGAAPAGYNGTFQCLITGASTFTYPLLTNPGSETTPGTYTPGEVNSLIQRATTFFGQGTQQSVYVLELGEGTAADGVTFLTNWITQNPNFFYSYLVPRFWDGNASFLAMLASFEGLSAKTYFFVTTTLQNYGLYTSLMKCVVPLIEAPAYGAWAANVLTAISYSGAWGSNALTAISWSASNGGTVTATTTTAHTVLPGEFFTITGCTPAGYNGTFLALTGTTAETLVYALATNPGAESALGTLAAATNGTVTATTTSNHGILPGQYFQIAGTIPTGYNGWFLALAGTATNTIVYALPANPGGESTLGTLVQSQYASAGIPSTEFSLAAVFQVTLNYRPTSTNKVTPLNYAFVFGVTPFPTQGNAALITTLLNANINLIGTGAQGGISDTLVLGGTMKDGNPFKYWYSVDWAQINLQQNAIAALIAGANNPQAPVDYNQNGINVLQQSAISTMSTGISSGLVLNPIQPLTLDAAEFTNALNEGTYDGFTLVNADPMGSYTTENPNDYAAGVYNGISVDYVPLRGFTSITFNLNISSFAG